MKTILKKVYELELDDVFIMDGVEYIVTAKHHNLIFYIETSDRNGRSKFMAELQFKMIEVYD